jgi:hypothetical protein
LRLELLGLERWWAGLPTIKRTQSVNATINRRVACGDRFTGTKTGTKWLWLSKPD